MEDPNVHSRLHAIEARALKLECWGKPRKTIRQRWPKSVLKRMMERKGNVVSGWKSKLQTPLAHVIPSEIVVGLHRKQAEPGSGKS